MRQKFPGAALLQANKWKNKSQIWDSSKGKWVKFASNATHYSQALQEYLRQQR